MELGCEHIMLISQFAPILSAKIHRMSRVARIIMKMAIFVSSDSGKGLLTIEKIIRSLGPVGNEIFIPHRYAT